MPMVEMSKYRHFVMVQYSYILVKHVFIMDCLLEIRMEHTLMPKAPMVIGLYLID